MPTQRMVFLARNILVFSYWFSRMVCYEGTINTPPFFCTILNNIFSYPSISWTWKQLNMARALKVLCKSPNGTLENKSSRLSLNAIDMLESGMLEIILACCMKCDIKLRFDISSCLYGMKFFGTVNGTKK